MEAWSVSNFVLESALRSYNGDIYNRVFKKAHKENSLNQLTFNSDKKSEETVMRKGGENARRRLKALALSVASDEQPVKSNLYIVLSCRRYDGDSRCTAFSI